MLASLVIITMLKDIYVLGSKMLVPGNLTIPTNMIATPVVRTLEIQGSLILQTGSSFAINVNSSIDGMTFLQPKTNEKQRLHHI